MSALAYNGIPLKIVDTQGISRRPILSSDGTTYLYTEHVFDVNCVFNPMAMSHTANGAAATGQLPAITDVGIRHILAQPRGILIFSDDMGNVILRSPKVGYTSDCKNGPICEEAPTVIQIHGSKSWAVKIRLATWVNECVESRVVLSHRWKRFVDVDQDYFSVVVTEGEVVFNVGELLKRGTFPDQYRRNWFHRIAPTFKREAIHVAPSSDGARVEYRVIDREYALGLGPICHKQNATRIEAWQTSSYSRTGSGIMAQAAVQSVVGSVVQMVISQSGGAAGVSIAGAQSGLGATIGNLPKSAINTVVRVWGNAFSKRKNLQEIGLGVALRRTGGFLASVKTALSITHDLMGKYVEIQMTNMSGEDQTFGVGGSSWERTVASFPDNDNTDGMREPTFNVGIVEPIIGDNFSYPRPPAANDSRGTWLGTLVANLLQGSCELPAPPPTDFPVTIERPTA